jgi:hypothetical protein
MAAAVEWARRRVGSKVKAGRKFVDDVLLEKSL